MTNETTQLERISSMIDAFSTAFGSARVGIYRLPKIHDHTLFARYLNSFLSLLRRSDCRPVYSWSYDSNRDCYNLILVINGCFRNDMQDITDAAQRIWMTYSAEPMQFIADMPVKSNSLDYDKQKILDTLFSSSFFPTLPHRILNPHQRAFACSRVF